MSFKISNGTTDALVVDSAGVEVRDGAGTRRFRFSEIDCVLSSGDFGRVQPAIDVNDRFTFARQRSRALVVQSAPIGELVDIMDVGYTCAFLATPYARRMTGNTVFVDGGVSIIG